MRGRPCVLPCSRIFESRKHGQRPIHRRGNVHGLKVAKLARISRAQRLGERNLVIAQPLVSVVTDAIIVFDANTTDPRQV
jgi:hypothetical protein